MTSHYRCCGQVYFSEAAFSEHLRREHHLAPSELLAAPFTSFSTFTMCVRVDKLVGQSLPACFYVDAFHNSQNGNSRSKEVKE